MEDTLHELANQTEMRNQYKDQSQQNGESNANVNKASDNSSFRINSGSGIPDQLQSSDKVHSEEADQHQLKTPLELQSIEQTRTPKHKRMSHKKPMDQVDHNTGKNKKNQ